MFRFRESFPDQDTVFIWVDGSLRDCDSQYFRDILEKYLGLNRKIYVNLSQLNHVGWQGKKLLQEIRDRVEFIDLPDYLKAEILDGDVGELKK